MVRKEQLKLSALTFGILVAGFIAANEAPAQETLEVPTIQALHIVTQ